ncbi:MAG: hypothetical protein QXQ19_01010 [Candidatus Aenigmatarchaeota archaeon]
MTTFSEFIINLFQKIGIYYVFSIIFIALVFYILSFNLLKRFSKDILDDKKINIISTFLAICIAILASYVYRISYMFSYFLALLSSMSIILLFAFAIFIFVTEKKPTISDTGMRNIFIVILIFLVAFIFISFYFAYMDILSPLAYGRVEETTGIYDLFLYIFRAEIFIIPFLFVILGLAIMALSSGKEEKK